MKKELANVQRYSMNELSLEESEQTIGGFNWAGGSCVFNQLGNWVGQGIEAGVNAITHPGDTLYSIANGLSAVKG